MFMIQDGIIPSVERGAVENHAKKMTQKEQRLAARRYRKAWRKADKHRRLRWIEPEDTRMDFGSVHPPGNVRMHRAKIVKEYYLQKAMDTLNAKK